MMFFKSLRLLAMAGDSKCFDGACKPANATVTYGCAKFPASGIPWLSDTRWWQDSIGLERVSDPSYEPDS